MAARSDGPTVSMRIRDTLHGIEVREARDRAEAARVAAWLSPAPAEAAPSDSDLADLAKAERTRKDASAAMKAALRALRAGKPGGMSAWRQAEAGLAKAQKARDEVAARIETRRLGALNMADVLEGGRLEALRGGELVEDDPRHAPGRRRRMSPDGLVFLLEKTDGAGRELPRAERRDRRRGWVAGMLFRGLFEHAGGGASASGGGDGTPGLGAVRKPFEVRCGGDGLVEAGSAVVLPMLAREAALLHRAIDGGQFAEIERAVLASPRGARKWSILCEVAGAGRSLEAVAGHGRRRDLAQVALLKALETVAAVLRLP